MYLAASIFLLTAIATWLHISMMVTAAYLSRGKQNPLEDVAIVGYLILVIGSIRTFRGQRSGGIIAGLGCILLWVFYVPHMWEAVTNVTVLGLKFHLFWSFAPVLLLCSSILCPIVIRHRVSEPLSPQPLPE